MSDVKATLTARGQRYGSFSRNAQFTQTIKQIMRSSQNWDHLADDQKEALEMLAHKVARILCGESMYIDSWRDCIGYLQLVCDRLQETEGATDVTTTPIRREGGKWKTS